MREYIDVTHKKICHKVCRQKQCVSTELDYRILSTVHGTFDYINDSRKLTQVRLYRPPEPEKIYTYKPKTSIAEYFSFCGGTLGLWFGLSIIKLYESLKNYVKPRFFNKKSTVKVQNLRHYFHAHNRKRSAVFDQSLFHVSDRYFNYR